MNKALVSAVVAAIVLGPAAGAGAGWWAGQHYAEPGPAGPPGAVGAPGLQGPPGAPAAMTGADLARLAGPDLSGAYLLQRLGTRCPRDTAQRIYSLNLPLQPDETFPPPVPITIPVCQIR